MSYLISAEYKTFIKYLLFSSIILGIENYLFSAVEKDIKLGIENYLFSSVGKGIDELPTFCRL